MCGLQLGDGGTNAPCDVHFSRALGPEHLEADNRSPVLRGNRAWLRHRIENSRHLIQPDVPTIGQRDVQASQFLGCLDRGNGAHRLFSTAHIPTASRCFLLNHFQAARDVDGSDAQCGHLVGVEFDAHLAAHTAHALDCADTGHIQQAFGDRVVDEPAQCLVIHQRGPTVGGRRGSGRERHHDTAGGRCLGDRRVTQVGRQVGPYPGHRIANVVDGLGDRLFEDEFDGDGDVAVQYLGVDVLDALKRGDRIFDLSGHFGFQLSGRGTGQRGVHGDDWQLDVGKVLHHVGAVRQQACQRQQREQHDGGNRVPDGQRRKIHTGSSGLRCRR